LIKSLGGNSSTNIDKILMTDDNIDNCLDTERGLSPPSQVTEAMAYLEQLSESILNNESNSSSPPSSPNPAMVSEEPHAITIELEQKQPDNVGLEEFDINSTLNSLETITLKKPNQVYYEIYKEARRKAKKAKREAVVAFLEAKNIKKTYMLEDFDESDSDSDDSNLPYDNEDEEDEEDEEQELNA
jgi:hypothetical protein